MVEGGVVWKGNRHAFARMRLSSGNESVYQSAMRASIFALLSLVVASTSQAATLAGQQVQPGGKIEIHFPVSKYFQDIASQAGNPRPDTGRAVLAFPAGFNPSRTWPILIVTSTSDF